MSQKFFAYILLSLFAPTGFAEEIPENQDLYMVGTIAGYSGARGVALLRERVTGITFTVREGESLGRGRSDLVKSIEVDRIVISRGGTLSAVVRDPFPESQMGSSVGSVPEENVYDARDSIYGDSYPSEQFPDSGYLLEDDFSPH